MRTLLDRIASFVSWHRRALGAAFAAAAVLTAINVARSEPPMTEVVVLIQDVPAGQRLTDADLGSAAVPESLELPALSREEAIGQVAAVPLASGSVLERGDVTSTASLKPGRTVVPITVADESLRALLSPGDPISLVMVTSESAEVLTDDARVTAMPATAGGDSLLGQATAGDSPVVLVEVNAKDAPTVAALGQSGQLSVVLGSM